MNTFVRIGGLKDKVIAARRSGHSTVIIPEDNQFDFEILPAFIKKDIHPHFVSHYEKVFPILFPKFKNDTSVLKNATS